MNCWPIPGPLASLLPLAHLLRVLHEQQPHVARLVVHPDVVPPAVVELLAVVGESPYPLAGV
jgi:hypothetical protein